MPTHFGCLYFTALNALVLLLSAVERPRARQAEQRRNTRLQHRSPVLEEEGA
jgi:hypothetical protein